MWIFPRSLGVNCYGRWRFSEGHKSYFKDQCLANSLQPTFSIFTAFLTQLNGYIIFDSDNSLKFRFTTNIWGLHSNSVGCESFHESNSPDILALSETNLEDSIHSSILSVWGYLLIRKDSVTHMHDLVVCVKEGLFFWRLILKNSKDSYLCFRLPLLHSVSYFFLFCWSPSSSPSSSNISDVLSVNPSANAFIFGNFNDGHQKDWLSCSDGTDRPGELWSWKTSDGWLFFLNPWLWFSQFGFFVFLFFSFDPITCSAVAYPRNSDHVVSLSIDFPLYLKKDTPFYMTYNLFFSRWEWSIWSFERGSIERYI